MLPIFIGPTHGYKIIDIEYRTKNSAKYKKQPTTVKDKSLLPQKAKDVAFCEGRLMSCLLRTQGQRETKSKGH